MKTNMHDGHTFGCCHLWHVCKNGHEPCPRFKEKPDYVAGCDCFKRYMKLQKSKEKEPLSNNVSEETITDFGSFDEEGQGYLF
ncbi:hypothetical protein [Aneurinibacillus aneurinilyticus]|uniref:hypothetical protein n=1 Tax=Aneurinibacillus aneurinilyticus TaxID=1391 RepID=UPI0035255760